MDVHHHPHIEKKTFKEYFLEFMMIFLAVTMGFIAESIREKISDHEREMQYLNSMKEDLKSDTSLLTQIIKFDSIKNRKIDTLLDLIDAKSEKNDNKKLFLSSITLFNFITFTPNDRTMTQLKNAGGLRLISNQKVSDSIINYDEFNKYVIEQGDIVKQSYLETMKFVLQFMDLKIAKKYTFIGLRNAPDSEFKFIRAKDTFRSFYNKSFMLQQLINVYDHDLKIDKDLACNLIAFLNKETK